MIPCIHQNLKSNCSVCLIKKNVNMKNICINVKNVMHENTACIQNAKHPVKSVTQFFVKFAKKFITNTYLRLTVTRKSIYY